MTLSHAVAASTLVAAGALTTPQAEQFLVAVREGQAAEVKRLLAADPALLATRTAKGTSAATVALFVQQGIGFVPPKENPVLAELLAHGIPLDRFEAAALSTPARLAKELDNDPQFVEGRTSYGWTPLHLAAFAGNMENATLLLDRGAQVDAVAASKFANTPLQVSLLTGQEQMARLLVKRGASVSLQQAEGFTALHEAAQLGNESLIALFLSRGADPNAKGKDGRTPLDVARKQKHQGAVKLLEAHGARP